MTTKTFLDTKVLMSFTVADWILIQEALALTEAVSHVHDSGHSPGEYDDLSYSIQLQLDEAETAL